MLNSGESTLNQCTQPTVDPAAKYVMSVAAVWMQWHVMHSPLEYEPLSVA